MLYFEKKTSHMQCYLGHSRGSLISAPCNPPVSLFFSQLFGDIFQIIDGFNVNHAASLTRTPHQLLCASIQHPHLSITSYGEIV